MVENQWKLWNNLTETIKFMDPNARTSYHKFSNQLYNFIVMSMEKYKGKEVSRDELKKLHKEAKGSTSPKNMDRNEL